MSKRIVWSLIVVAVLLLPCLIWSSPQQAASQEPVEVRQSPAEVTAEAGYLSPGGRHKLRLEDRGLARELTAKGGRLIADYDSYQVVEVDSATAQSYKSRYSAEVKDEYNLILLNAGSIDTTTPQGQELSIASVGSNESSGRHMHLVQFAGPIKPEWYDALVATGVEVVTYIPNNAYLVYGDSRSLRRIDRLAKNQPVQWQGEYADAYKIDPAIYMTEKRNEDLRLQGKIVVGGANLYTVQLFKSSKGISDTASYIDSVKLEEKVRWDILNYTNITVALQESAVKNIASRPDVVFIEPFVMPKKLDERQNMVISGNITSGAPNTGLSWFTYLANKGFTQAQFDTSNFTVNISDSGLDNANVASPNHFAFYRSGDITSTSRVVYARLVGTPNSGSTTQGCDGHGTLNSSIIMGNVPNGTVGGVNFNAVPHADASGFHYGLGVNPFVKIGSSVIFDPDTFTSPNVTNLEAQAYNDGARISSNSWGNSSNTYGTFGQSYDAIVRDAQSASSSFPAAGNQEYVIIFAAGNGGSGANTVGQPGTAKNIITAGASEGVQAFGAADQCGISDTGADNANDIISFSSRGPTSDGRKKPDIVAPGTHISGVVAQATKLATGVGAQNACFDASGVCAGPGVSNFWPLAQQFYTASDGTSHSTPAIAGAASLVRQFFINQFAAPPSAAMTKAALMNSASYMNGTGANDTLWSNNQGMGLMNIDRLFTTIATNSILRDQQAADLFTATGQQRVINATVADNTKPLRVTLAWTDAPGPTSGNAFVNNLDLTVTAGGNTYKGNVFSGANSATGGSADAANNVESVFLPAGVTGPVLVTVKATNIAGDGVPNVGGALDQDYALVITNVTPSGAQASITSAGATLVSESCTPANGALDPNEGVTVSFCIQNVGSANTSSALTGTLQATGGVTGPSGAQTYGVVVAGGPPVCRNFSFTVSGTCGGTVTATIHFQDGATDLGNVTYTFTLGVLNTVFTQNFDGVTAPALPAGWTTSFVNGGTCTAGSNWATTTTNVDTAPNAAFHNDPNCITDNYLVSPSVNITTANAQLTFRNAFNLEAGFDGGVLEVSTDAGATWADITSGGIGGSFTAGGYNRTISSSFSSPIAGRMAWSALSGGTTATPSYITSSANLGPNVAGKTIKLRWRVASDSSVSATGQWVDSIGITDGYTCSTVCGGCTLTCPANITKSNDPNQCGAVVTYPAPTGSGSCGTITCSPASGSFFPKGTTTVTCSATGANCSFTVTINDTQPPTITCPPNQTAVTTTPGASSTPVSYPPPTASDNCPGVTTQCTPPSGSNFALGTTTVTCTATDTSGNTATCSFTVTVFNGRLQDDFEACNDTVLFNTVTGDFRWCCHGTIFTGRAKVTQRGNTYTLVLDAQNGRVQITLNAGASTPNGTASLQVPPGKTACTITDRDIRNDTCVCGGAGGGAISPTRIN
jgi:Subtilase family/HYR domain